MSAGRCPDCQAPLQREGHCPTCGWDGELENDEGYLDGVELPPDEIDYDEVLEREGLRERARPALPPSPGPGAGGDVRAAWMILILALGMFVALALLGR